MVFIILSWAGMSYSHPYQSTFLYMSSPSQQGTGFYLDALTLKDHLSGHPQKLIS